MSDIAVSRERLDIGRVLRTAVEVTRRNLGPMLLLAALFASLPTLALGVLAARFNASVQEIGAVDRLLGICLGVLLQGALIHLTLADLNGRPAAWTEAVSTGFRSWWGLFRLDFIVGVATLLGMLLFLAPGIMLGVMWSVAAPAYLAEPKGASAALSQSGDLTKGHRWRVLALYLIYGVAAILLTIVAAALLGGVFGVFVDGGGAVIAGKSIAALLIGSLNGPIFAVLYTELRRLKEGATQIAAVFD